MGGEISAPIINIAKHRSNSDQKDADRACRCGPLNDRAKPKSVLSRFASLFLPLYRHKVVPIACISFILTFRKVEQKIPDQFLES
jgi:hypothetical protein